MRARLGLAVCLSGCWGLLLLRGELGAWACWCACCVWVPGQREEAAAEEGGATTCSDAGCWVVSAVLCLQSVVLLTPAGHITHPHWMGAHQHPPARNCSHLRSSFLCALLGANSVTSRRMVYWQQQVALLSGCSRDTAGKQHADCKECSRGLLVMPLSGCWPLTSPSPCTGTCQTSSSLDQAALQHMDTHSAAAATRQAGCLCQEGRGVQGAYLDSRTPSAGAHACLHKRFDFDGVNNVVAQVSSSGRRLADAGDTHRGLTYRCWRWSPHLCSTRRRSCSSHSPG